MQKREKNQKPLSIIINFIMIIIATISILPFILMYYYTRFTGKMQEKGLYLMAQSLFFVMRSIFRSHPQSSRPVYVRCDTFCPPDILHGHTV